MTTPTGAADERERLIDYLEVWHSTSASAAADMLRADAETIRGLTEMRDIFERQWNVTCEQLAAQSAELERVKMLAAKYKARGNDTNWPQAASAAFNLVAQEINEALAAPSAAGGYKEPSEAQMFGGDLYSGIKP